MILAVMTITYLGLSLIDKRTNSPQYTSTAVAAVYPMNSSYRYHTIETVSYLSSKTEEINSVFNSALFQSGLYNQEISLKDCSIDSSNIAYTNLLVMHSSSEAPEIAYNGIPTALDYYSQFSGNITGSPEIKIILGPVQPLPSSDGSKIQKNKSRLCVLVGLMMAGLLLFIYVSRKTYKTENCIRRRYKNVRFFSLPFIKSETKSKKGILIKKNRQVPIRRLALEIRQVLHKYNKNTLFVTSCADKENRNVFLSELARELSEQNEKVIVIGMEAWQHNSAPGSDESDDMKKNTLMDVLQQKCTLKEAMAFSEELNGYYIRYVPDSIDEDISYSIDDIRRVLSNCLEHADIVLVNGSAWYSSHYAQMWQEAVDASLAMCQQDDADYFKVDKMLSDLQKEETYFVGCVLFGF